MTNYAQINYLVKNAYIVNDLINAGYIIVCIAPNKYNPDASVFYFAPTEGLDEAVRQAYLKHGKDIDDYD